MTARTSISAPSIADENPLSCTLRKNKHARQICSIYRPTTNKKGREQKLETLVDRLTEVGDSHREVQTPCLKLIRLIKHLSENYRIRTLEKVTSGGKLSIRNFQAR